MENNIKKKSKIYLAIIIGSIFFLSFKSENLYDESFLKPKFQKGNPKEKLKNGIHNKKAGLVFRVSLLEKKQSNVLEEDKNTSSDNETILSENTCEFNSLASAQFYRNKIWETRRKKSIIIILLNGKKIGMTDLEKMGYFK